MSYIRQVPDKDRSPIETLTLIDLGLELTQNIRKELVLDNVINIGILIEQEGYQYATDTCAGLAVGPSSGFVFIKDESEDYAEYVVLKVSEDVEYEEKLFDVIVTDDAMEVHEYKPGEWEQVIENLANNYRGIHGKEERTRDHESGGCSQSNS